MHWGIMCIQLFSFLRVQFKTSLQYRHVWVWTFFRRVHVGSWRHTHNCHTTSERRHQFSPIHRQDDIILLLRTSPIFLQFLAFTWQSASGTVMLSNFVAFLTIWLGKFPNFWRVAQLMFLIETIFSGVPRGGGHEWMSPRHGSKKFFSPWITDR